MDITRLFEQTNREIYAAMDDSLKLVQDDCGLRFDEFVQSAFVEHYPPDYQKLPSGDGLYVSRWRVSFRDDIYPSTYHEHILYIKLTPNPDTIPTVPTMRRKK